MATQTSLSPRPIPKRILKLDQTVVNKIAAGEIIVRPANAVKEMMENSLDAGSTDIIITIKNGGLDLIQIQDNGCGIRKDDLPIACERFTTSKINSFEDLTSLSSFGFRGEALSSISYIAKVKITTRTADAVCAFQMEYGLGQPLGLGKLCAGNVGTIITVENFFYNNPVRKSILSSPTEEYVRLAEFVTKYAVRYPNVGFTLKKFGQHVADIRTPPSSSTLENCKLLFGNTITRELVLVEGETDKYHCKVAGYVSNPNFSIKKITFLLFINGRSVDCNKLKRSLELIYAAHLPKNGFPFIYLSLELPPGLIDVNIHPTKAEVYFRFEEEIISFIVTLVQSKIMASQTSRTFTIQTQLPRSVSQGSSTMDIDYQASLSPARGPKKADPRKMVRTDYREQTLDAFIRPPSVINRCLHSHGGGPSGSGGKVSEAAPETNNDDELKVISVKSRLVAKRCRRKISLTSLLELKADVEETMDANLRRLLAEHKFVGCASYTTALIQHQTRLFAVDVSKLSEELFYQMILYDFGNFGICKAAEPVSLSGLMETALEFSDEPIEDPTEREAMVERAVELLMSKGPMLADYFSIQFSKDKELVGLPLLLPDYIPPLSDLPNYVARLVTEVDWTKEKECFNNIARITAQFYSFRRDFYAEAIEEEGDKAWKWTVQHTLFPAFRSMLQPGPMLHGDRTFVQLADLPHLYKIFERC
ncbi:DNA mismatch repair protein Mlh1 [Hypsibius exemplaris]|uniref:DNA mismatch repair protein Mlh1 n=1 Tax=Hypsibius exemplaris TaxID=2072580 RepID=A0A1W0WMW6_HYPEX|nr:DNA mismatch repair protein Mlh1 [Hypsibius exemplaris]